MPHPPVGQRAVESARLIGGKDPQATPNVLDAFGKDWFEIKEGEASIFKPDGSGSFALIDRVQIGDWAAARK